MINVLLSAIAPHYCCGCDKIGSLLCDDCKNYITSEIESVCIVCGCLALNSCLCNKCMVPYECAWVVGERKDALQRLIGLYKFERAKSAYKCLSELLDETLPELPPNTVIVPIPTAPSHIRERNYDHMLLIARNLAKLRNLKCRSLIGRKTNTKQRQASAKQRLEQARNAFYINDSINPDISYLIVDDVFTTGATIKCASSLLSKAGAKHVWIAIIARQTLD